MIEQISGSLKYKADYERKKEIRDSTSNINSLSHRKKRLFIAEIKQYRVQADEARIFEKMIHDRDVVVLKHSLWKLYHLEKTGEASEIELNSLFLQINDKSHKVNELQLLFNTINKKFAVSKSEVIGLERDTKTQEKIIQEKKNYLLPVDEKINMTQQNIKKIKGTIGQLKPNLTHQSETIETLQKDMSIVEEEKEKFENQSSQIIRTAGLDLSDDDIEEYENLKSKFAQATSDRQSEIDGFKRRLKTEEEKVKTLESKYNQLKVQEGVLSKEVTDLRIRLQSHESQSEEYTTDLKLKNKLLNDIVTERRNKLAKEHELQAKLQEVTDFLVRYSVNHRENERDARMKDEVATMKRCIPGVKGFVFDLCQPKQRKYDTAISTVLGKNFNSIVVDSFQTAQQCLSYIKERRVGIATFIPLDSVVVQPINNKLRGISNKVRLAVDTVDYDPELDAAINYVCGSAVVCDDLNTAKYVRWTKNIDVKAVTLDGAVIHKAGLMTGGRVENKNSQQWNDKEISRAKKKKEEYQAQMHELNKSKFDTHEEQLRSDIAGSRLKLDVITEEISNLQGTLKGREVELQHIVKSLKDIELPLANSRDILFDTKSRYKTLQSLVEKTEDRIFAQFVANIGVENIREYRKAQSGFITEISQKRLDFVNQISRLNNQIQFEIARRDDTQSRIDVLNEKLSRENNRLIELEKEKEILSRQIMSEVSLLEDAKQDVSSKREALEELSHEISDCRGKLSAIQNEQDLVQKQITLRQEEIFKIAMGRIKTLKDCKIEGIELPLLSGSLNMIKMEGSHNDEEIEEESINPEKDQREILKSIIIDYSGLSDDLKLNDDESVGEQLERDVQLLTINLEKMVVNSRARDRLDEAEKKLREVDDDAEKTRSDHKKAKDDFESVKRRRYELFNRAYKHISSQIDKIYKELTKTPTFPLGGTATLSLEDEDEPYLDGVNYHAMPPMKRFCDMELLSGGEKTMAALALLFAIHSYHPSPFFVLDEVDAALDNANVGNIARYIQRHAGPGFQFIVISLKNGLFENSQSLVGIYRDQDENSSRALTIDLQMYSSSSVDSKNRGNNSNSGETSIVVE